MVNTAEMSRGNIAAFAIDVDGTALPAQAPELFAELDAIGFRRP